MGKDKEKTEGELAEQEYDKAFAELKAEDNKEAGKEEDPEKKGLHEEEKTPDAPAKEDPKEPVDENHGNLESVSKALKDTKQHATNLEGDKATLLKANKELEDKLQDYVDGKATGDDITEAQEKQVEAVESLKTLKAEAEKTAEDYPELATTQAVTIKLIETLLAGEDRRINERKETSKKNKEDRVDKIREDFERDILPEVTKVHSDFKEIVDGANKQDYFDWAAKVATPAQRTAACYSDDPQDIIGAVTAFKKYKAGEQVPDEERKQTISKQERLTNAMSLKGGKSQFKTKASEKDDPNDYDSAWKKADEQIKETPAL